jgi:hypothetical protein
MCMFAKELECSLSNKTLKIAQANPMTKVFTPQPISIWIQLIWKLKEWMLSNFEVGQQEDWEPAWRTNQQSIKRESLVTLKAGYNAQSIQEMVAKG